MLGCLCPNLDWVPIIHSARWLKQVALWHLYGIPDCMTSVSITCFNDIDEYYLWPSNKQNDISGWGEGGGLWKSTFLNFLVRLKFLLFSWGFLALKKCWCIFFLGWEGVSESVWFVHSWKCWHLWMALKIIFMLFMPHRGILSPLMV